MAAILKAGRYEIVGELGRGAMGVVYKALDPVIGRAVAVKTIKLSEEGTGLTRLELLKRFQTEARAAGLLTHPNIVVIFDAGEEDGLYYITMELVEGKSVQALIDAGHAFPLPRVLRIMEQACSALQFAHERNVVHRDIKPANIMLTGDDTVKVTDFGTAKILQIGTVQQTAHVMGTPSYMSPEQVKGRAVDGRSDIFSLGVMLYEMITGEKPFPGQSITTVIYKIVNEEPVPPRQINPSIHPGISAAVMKALAKDPEMRYQSCREMLEDLRNYRATANVGGNPQSTMVAGGPGAPNATIVAGGGLRGLHNSNDALTAATAQSLAARTANPMQTPGLRRTGPVTPYQEPKKNSLAGTLVIALVLLGVIGYGTYKLRPVYYDVRQNHVGPVNSANEVPATPGEAATATPEVQADAGGSGQPAAAQPSEGNSAAPAGAPPPTVVEAKTPDVAAERAAPKKMEPGLSPKAAEFKRRVEEVIAQRGLTGRAKVQGVGNTLVLAGKLRPAEHGGLLNLLRDAPAAVRIVDHVEDDSPATGNPAEVSSQKLVLEPLAKGLLVNSDPPGADVFVNGAKQLGQTPVTLPLAPGQYNLVLRLQGYGPYAGSVQVKDNAQTQLGVKLTEKSASRVAWAQVETKPNGADIWVDGNPTGKSTPSRIELPTGLHTVTMKLDGFQPLKRTVQVSEGGTVKITESFKPK